MTSITSFFVCLFSFKYAPSLPLGVHSQIRSWIIAAWRADKMHAQGKRQSLTQEKETRCISPFLWILTLPNYKLQIPGNCLTENGEGAWKFSKTRDLLPGRGLSRKQMRETQELRGFSESKVYAFAVFEAGATVGGYTDLSGWWNHSVWYCNDGSRDHTM